MAASSLSAYGVSISISSPKMKCNQWKNEAALQSSLFYNSPLKASTTAHFINNQFTLSVSSTPRSHHHFHVPRNLVVNPKKFALEAGKATPAPPLGRLWVQTVNIAAFCKDYNARSADKAGYVILVEVTVYDAQRLNQAIKNSSKITDWIDADRAGSDEFLVAMLCIFKSKDLMGTTGKDLNLVSLLKGACNATQIRNASPEKAKVHH